MKKLIILAIIAILTGVIFWIGIFAWRNFRGSRPAFLEPNQNITDLIPSPSESPSSQPENTLPAENATNMPLKLPDGFRISIFAKNLPGARVMALDTLGNMWLSRPNANVVTLLEFKTVKW